MEMFSQNGNTARLQCNTPRNYDTDYSLKLPNRYQQAADNKYFPDSLDSVSIGHWSSGFQCVQHVILRISILQLLHSLENGNERPVSTCMRTYTARIGFNRRDYCEVDVVMLVATSKSADCTATTSASCTVTKHHQSLKSIDRPRARDCDAVCKDKTDQRTTVMRKK